MWTTLCLRSQARGSVVASTPTIRTSVKLTPRNTINPDDNVGKGMDLALITLLFLGIGFALDRAFDTKPLWMIVLTLFALVGKGAGMYYAYQARMQGLEAERSAGQYDAPRAHHTPIDLSDAPAGVTPEQFT